MTLTRCLFLTGIVALPMLLVAQSVPNAGFENWTSGVPDMWTTTNVPGVVVPITQSSTAHSGSSAVQGTVLTFSNSPYPPFLQSYFPVNASYGTCSGWFQFTPAGGDSLVISVVAWKNQNLIGGGSLETGVTAGTYTQFSFPIDYFAAGPADSMWILISVESSSDVHAGTTFLIDDLTLSNPTAVAKGVALPAAYSLGQNYPNPFNPSTTISYDLPERSTVRLTVLNVLGQTVAELTNGIVDGGHASLTWQATVPSGVYFYRLEARSVADPSRTFSQVRRMVVLK